MTTQRFETLEDNRIVHIGTSGKAGVWPASRAAPCEAAEPVRHSIATLF
jgi:hypothetical protein